ncbi:MAG: type II toxin-antitoxin system HipA family toxin [Bacteroidales bacterium]|nr:type II toxin-antitoxin system HipA family toxin [Bacteroidales bacterium]
MKKLFVYADFDWLPNPTLIGTLIYESIRGRDSYGFEYHSEWLRKYGSINLSEDISNFPGLQYTKQDADIFGCFADALPDRWGRTLLNRREQIEAVEEKRDMRRLSSYDYLTGIDDYSRMGGFRFKESADGEFICLSTQRAIPPLASIRELSIACQQIEQSEVNNLLPEKKWIQQLVHPGTSLGGARPKAVVIDEQHSLHVAKFPSRTDDYDVALWEHLCHVLAREAGITVAETRVLKVEKYHTLLSKRFDRSVDGGRIHFASAMTLLGLTDGCNADSGHGYLDIVDFIVRGCCDVEANLRELYRRVAFNICVGNSDDHFRNHGFLLTPRGWTLSPAYDMNPTNNMYQSLLISRASNRADLYDLLDAAEDYMLQKEIAQQIIRDVAEAISGWKNTAKRLGIAQREISAFETRMAMAQVYLK